MENSDYSPSFKQADTYPAVKVSWSDAQTFCAWLTKKELAEGKIKAGQKYRLPTDTEWSVAVVEIGQRPIQRSLSAARVRSITGKIAGSFPSQSCQPRSSVRWASTRRVECVGRPCSSLWLNRLRLT